MFRPTKGLSGKNRWKIISQDSHISSNTKWIQENGTDNVEPEVEPTRSKKAAVGCWQ